MRSLIKSENIIGTKEAALTGEDFERLKSEGAPYVNCCDDDVAMVAYLREREDEGAHGLLCFYSLSPLDQNVVSLIDDLAYLSHEAVTAWIFEIKQNRYTQEHPELPRELQRLIRKETYTADVLASRGLFIDKGKCVYHYDKQSLIEHLQIRLDGDYELWGQDIVDDFDELSPAEVQQRITELSWFDTLFKGLRCRPAPLRRDERDLARFVEAQEEKIRENEERLSSPQTLRPRFKKKSSRIFRLLLWVREFVNNQNRH